MIEKRGLIQQNFLQKTPEMILAPTIITMPVTYAKYPEVKDGIDENYIKGCQYLLFQDYIKAFKCFRKTEKDVEFVTKVKNLFISKVIDDKNP